MTSVRPPGELHSVDGLQLHVLRSGPVRPDPSLPTIVIEAGAGCSGIFYSRLQRVLAQSYTVASHDRPGLGWSAADDKPLDGRRHADRLNALLQTVGVTGPIVLVAHSLGGLLARVFTEQYPERVVGAVMLDASHPRQLEELGEVPLDGYVSQRAALSAMEQGGPMPPDLDTTIGMFAGLPETIAQVIAITTPESIDATVLEIRGMPVLVEQVEAAGDLANRPLSVCWAPISVPEYNGLGGAQLQGFWSRYQSENALLSTHARIQCWEGADHMGIAMSAKFTTRAAAEVEWVVGRWRELSLGAPSAVRRDV